MHPNHTDQINRQLFTNEEWPPRNCLYPSIQTLDLDEAYHKTQGPDQLCQSLGLKVIGMLKGIDYGALQHPRLPINTNNLKF